MVKAPPSMKRMPSSDGAGVAGRDAAFMVGESSRSVVARRFAASSLGQLGKPFLELCQQAPARSEEHTSELQSIMRSSYAVFCLKKKKNHSNKSAHGMCSTEYKKH